MSENRLFVNRELFDRWVTDGRAELEGRMLRLRHGKGTFSIDEGACVVREVTGTVDAHGLVGTVRELRELVALGGEVMDSSLVVGDLAYDVVPGMLLRPSLENGSPAGPVKTAQALATLYGLSESRSSRQSDEELLAKYLIEKLDRR